MKLDEHLKSHLIDPSLMRNDRFEDFMRDRQRALVALIEGATGKAIPMEEATNVLALDDDLEAEFGVSDEDALVHTDEARLTLSNG
ncbi:hypothetical protein [Rhodococcus ruber]|uniref:hypothetical protein n=1 Tax=Rhodococcus ruber TaxID=1830 RepID=UPI001F2B8A51|nr:hypothetical protein [Rhodococcus ruber]MCF8783415.1 hypothetical protein [Rhodococcus ruber]